MEIISRSEWGARPPRSAPNRATWAQRDGVAYHYSFGPVNQTVRSIQDYHMDTNGWSDIGYNFLVDVHGRIYEGRGWTAIGAHVENNNTHLIGVCFIGRDGDLTDAAKLAMRWLWEEACRLAGKRLSQTYHSAWNATQCPGNVIRTWVFAGMPVSQPSNVEENMYVQHGQIPAGSGAVIVSTPWGASTISFGCDFGKARLRVAEFNINEGWRVHDFVVENDKPRVDLPIRAAVDRRSIVRLPLHVDDKLDTPVGYIVWGVM